MLFAIYISKTGIASHTIPVTVPKITPLTGFSNKCNFTVFFSISQKTNVKAIIDNSGIISAHNLHIAGSSEEDSGRKETDIAHPRKKTINFIIVIVIFFITVFPENSDLSNRAKQRIVPTQADL